MSESVHMNDDKKSKEEQGEGEEENEEENEKENEEEQEEENEEEQEEEKGEENEEENEEEKVNELTKEEKEKKILDENDDNTPRRKRETREKKRTREKKKSLKPKKKSQYFKHVYPKKLFLEFLRNVCEKDTETNQKYHVLNFSCYHKAFENNLLLTFLNKIISCYFESKKHFVVDSLSNYKSFLTMIRQQCHIHDIHYENKLEYHRSQYQIIYHIYLSSSSFVRFHPSSSSSCKTKEGEKETKEEEKKQEKKRI